MTVKQGVYPNPSKRKVRANAYATTFERTPFDMICGMYVLKTYFFRPA